MQLDIELYRQNSEQHTKSIEDKNMKLEKGAISNAFSTIAEVSRPFFFEQATSSYNESGYAPGIMGEMILSVEKALVEKDLYGKPRTFLADGCLTSAPELT